MKRSGTTATFPGRCTDWSDAQWAATVPAGWVRSRDVDTGPITPSGRALPGRSAIAPLAAAAALCAAMATLLTAAVLRGWPGDVDLALAVPVHEWAGGTLAAVPVAEVLRWTGSPVVLAPLSIALVILLAVRGHRGYAVYLAACALGGAVISEVMKEIVARPRPVWTDPLSTAADWSFPSGHALGGVTNWVVYGVIALCLIAGRRGRVVAVGCVVWGVLMAPSRIVLGVHWPTDVLGGWLFGGAWVLAVSAVALTMAHRAARPVAPA